MFETVACLFIFLYCLGLINPIASALSLAPFSKNIGSAAAALGFLQMSIGAIASTVIGILDTNSPIPLALALAVSSSLALCVLFIGKRKITETYS